jgi:hypothetical protein
MQCTPVNEHEWLQKFVGDWTFEGEAAMGPDKPPMKCTGTERARMLGGVWLIAEGQGPMPDGGAALTMLTLGYDPQKKRFVGTFIGSMMPSMWVYDGALDAAGKVLTLNTEGPNFAAEGKVTKYQDVIEFKSADYRVLTSVMLGEDGEWREFMKAHYRRAK